MAIIPTAIYPDNASSNPSPVEILLREKADTLALPQNQAEMSQLQTLKLNCPMVPTSVQQMKQQL